ncbi:MAG: carbohydrate kinase family protein [Parcubacteria group bacterium]|nr:carbohydrate kinase family protein [Parcubacteria group bacterium]|tara:strand:+ start:8984 stop:9955 length:972 start_codon:yes stop_codon:yes gene_type:complete
MPAKGGSASGGKQKILVAGSVAYDRIMNFPGYFKDNILPNKIHILNVSFFIQDLKESFGGTAGNIVYTLGLLGVKPTLLANVGAKDFSVYKKWFQKNKIDISKVKIVKNQQTASAYIITDKADNQITGFYPGAMKDPITKSKIDLAKVGLAIVSPQHPVDMVNLPKIFRAKKIPYIFDPGQQVASLSGAQLKSAIIGSKVLIGNDYEIALIRKKTSLSINQLLKKTNILITTLGASGSMLRQGSNTIKIPAAKRANTLDPTGGGDAYRAGLIKGLVDDLPLQKVGQLATVTAVYSVEKYGTQVHKFTKTGLVKRYRQNFKEPI